MTFRDGFMGFDNVESSLDWLKMKATGSDFVPTVLSKELTHFRELASFVDATFGRSIVMTVAKPSDVSQKARFVFETAAQNKFLFPILGLRKTVVDLAKAALSEDHQGLSAQAAIRLPLLTSYRGLCLTGWMQEAKVLTCATFASVLRDTGR